MVDVRIPKMGASTHEVDVLRVLVAPGARVAAGEPVAEIESEKASMMVVAPASGTVVEVLALEGTVCRVGAVLCRITEDVGEERQA